MANPEAAGQEPGEFAGGPVPAGTFHWHTAERRMQWSEGTFRIYGFRPGDVVPTVALLLAHKHPEDRPKICALLQRLADTGGYFLDYHRIVTAADSTRYVISVGEGRRAGDGSITVTGYICDVTDLRREESGAAAREAVSRARQSMAAIEQAKGALMALHGVGEEEAFALLARASQQRNQKLREVAADLLVRLQRPPQGDVPQADGRG
jgi:hypothetical protein